MSKILICGAAGFIGGHLTQELIRQGHEILGMDDLSIHNGGIPKWIDLTKKNGAKWLLGADGNCMVEWYMHKTIQDFNPSIIFNLAVLPLPHSLEHPMDNFITNTQITGNILEEIRIQNKERQYNDENPIRLVHFSSSEVYGTAQDDIMTEDHVLRPTTPYAAAKAACDHLVQSYVNTFGIDATIVRPFNCVGPRQNDKSYAAIIPLTVKRIKDGIPPIIYGDGSKTRDFCLTKNAKILMRNLSWKNIQDINPGDEIVSFDENVNKTKRTFNYGIVKKTTNYVSNDVYEIKTDKGTMKATGNHPWLTMKGRFTQTTNLRNNSKIKYMTKPTNQEDTYDFKIGYVVGAILGDGSTRSIKNEHGSSYGITMSSTDIEIVDVVKNFARETFEIEMKQTEISVDEINRLAEKRPERTIKAISTKKLYMLNSRRKESYEKFMAAVENIMKTTEMKRGYIAGLFDTEGYEHERWNLRLCNKVTKCAGKGTSIIDDIKEILTEFGFKHSTYITKNGTSVISILGGITEHTRFFTTFRPKLGRKFINLDNRVVNVDHAKIQSIVKTDDETVYNLEIDKGTYIADGFLCHNTAVEDIIRGAIATMERGKTGEVYNLCSSVETSVLQLMDMISDKMDYRGGYQFSDERPGDVTRHRGCNLKAKRELEWTPKVSIREAVRRAIHD